MNFDNITKENFKEYESYLHKKIEEKLVFQTENISRELETGIETNYIDKNGNNFFDTFESFINTGFDNLFKFSHKNNIYFIYCSSIVYENTFEDRCKDYENEFIDVKKIEFIKNEYYNVINKTEYFWYLSNWGLKESELIQNARSKKLEFLENLLLENNYIVRSNWDTIDSYDIEFIDLGNQITIQNTNPKHENIFCNNGFVLFEHILNEYIKPTKGRQTDLIFYYRKMYDNKPQYIHQKPTEFFNWFEREYDEVFGQLKTLSQVETPQRNKDYSRALNWFKQQPQQSTVKSTI